MALLNLRAWFASLSCVALVSGQSNAEAGQMHFTEPTHSMEFDAARSYFAVIHTSKGDITCELNYKEAPLSVTNFIQLAQGGFYDGLLFHRVEPRFVIQGGDPEGTGSGGPGYTLPAE